MANADFYLGRGPTARWLGSIDDFGTPDEIAGENLFREPRGRYTEQSYLDRVEQILILAGQGAHHPLSPWPDLRAWPHEYETSQHTDYAFCYTKNAIWVLQRGRLLATHHPNGASALEHFPIMEGAEK